MIVKLFYSAEKLDMEHTHNTDSRRELSDHVKQVFVRLREISHSRSRDLPREFEGMQGSGDKPQVQSSQNKKDCVDA
jgi:hypothetical protein